MNSIAHAIRTGDFAAYQAARYPAIQEGECVYFVNEDFSGVDFAAFSVGFFVFTNCNLDGVRNLYGQPIYLQDSSLRQADFCGAHAILHAINCDFTGLRYDDDTKLAYDDKTVSTLPTAPSTQPLSNSLRRKAYDFCSNI